MIKNSYGTLSISGYTVSGDQTYFHLSSEGDLLFIAGHSNAYQIALIESPNKLYLSEKVSETLIDERYTITDSETPGLGLPLMYAELKDTDLHLRKAFYLLDHEFSETRGL